MSFTRWDKNMTGKKQCDELGFSFVANKCLG